MNPMQSLYWLGIVGVVYNTTAIVLILSLLMFLVWIGMKCINKVEEAGCEEQIMRPPPLAPILATLIGSALLMTFLPSRDMLSLWHKDLLNRAEQALNQAD